MQVAILRSRNHYSRHLRQPLSIPNRICLATLGVIRVVRQFHAQERRLQCIEPEIRPDHIVVVFRLHAVDAHHARNFRQRIVIRHQQPGIAQRAEVLRREKAVRAKLAQRAHLPPSVLRAERLRGVFNHRKMVRLRQRKHTVHVRSLPK